MMAGYSHGAGLPPAVPGKRRELHSNAGLLSYYAAGPSNGARPLLLIHSINAAGSAYEVGPLYDHYCTERPVYALELPGFGFSERSARNYTPRLMTDAIHAMVAEIACIHGPNPIDAVALSLSAEFLARAASENLSAFRSLALISPTGFSATTPEVAPITATRAKPALRNFLAFPLWDRGIFRLLTSKPSIRYFLRKTWGSSNIDEGMVEYDYLTTRQPGARYAPYSFVSGFLFTAGIQQIYRSLELPVWMAHGVRGDFQDYLRAAIFKTKPNWTIQSFQTGALPHFEILSEVTRSYDEFLSVRFGTPRIRLAGDRP
jgi:pimeloyl-ACP methyl ester carboxylesterase